MKTKTTFLQLTTRIAVMSLLGAAHAVSSGIPEPALILYGSVTNTAGPLLLTSGGVNWLVAGGDSSASASSTIASVNGQFFYVAHTTRGTRTMPGFTPKLGARNSFRFTSRRPT